MTVALDYDQAAHAIAGTGRRLHQLGLAAATSGNFSMRLRDGRIAITVSGRHKGRLNPEDIMLVDLQGTALEDKKPSAETALHTFLYAHHPRVNAVLHVHSVAGVVLTRQLSSKSEIVLAGYEMLKAFPGVRTHETTVRIPVFENAQDVQALARTIAQRLSEPGGAPAYLIRGHGVYAWGRDMDEAERIIEALEHLMLCELEALRLRGGTA